MTRSYDSRQAMQAAVAHELAPHINDTSPEGAMARALPIRTQWQDWLSDEMARNADPNTAIWYATKLIAVLCAETLYNLGGGNRRRAHQAGQSFFGHLVDLTIETTDMMEPHPFKMPEKDET
jgi:hypothetical protein